MRDSPVDYTQLEAELLLTTVKNASELAGYSIMLELLLASKEHMGSGTLAFIQFYQVNGQVLIDAIFVRKHLSKKERFMSLVHECGHVIDMITCSQSVGKLMESIHGLKSKSEKISQPVIGAYFESEKRAWSLGMDLLNAIGTPYEVKEQYWDCRVSGLSSSLESWMRWCEEGGSNTWLSGNSKGRMYRVY